MTRIFLTGATGYIGGQALYSICTALPDLSVRALVRDAAKAQVIKAAFPNVEPVEGSLDDLATIQREVMEADIILNLADTTHMKSVRVIHRGVIGNDRTGNKPAYWIQMSTGRVLAAAEIDDSSYIPGSSSDTTFDDLEGIVAIQDVIKKHPFRDMDNYILDVAASSWGVNTALIIGPLIYGKGQGPVNQGSLQLETITRTTLQRGRGVQVGKGESRWGDVHISDLGDLFVCLVKAAVNGRANEDQIWNANGIYIPSIGERSFGELSRRVAATAAQKGLISTDEVDEVLQDEAKELHPAAAILFGTNARGIGRRGRELLGWEPKYGENGIVEDISRVVDEEAQALGRT